MPRLVVPGSGGGAYTPAPPGPPSFGSDTQVNAGSTYKAFPGLTKVEDGTYLLVYRDGPTHVDPDTGVIKVHTSSDGVTWSAASTLIDPSTVDARDPSLATLSGGTVALSFFTYDTPTALGVWIALSSDDGATFGTAVAVTNSYTQIACSGPVLEVNGSLWLQPVYALTGGNWIAAVAKSTDQGASWGDLVTVASGGGKQYYEPWVVKLHNGDLMCMVRAEDPKQILRYTSDDDGATWTNQGSAFTGESRCATFVHPGGGVIVAYREAISGSTYDLKVRYSEDSGATWSSATTFAGKSDYAALTDDLMAWAVKNTDTDADVFVTPYEWAGVGS